MGMKGLNMTMTRICIHINRDFELVWGFTPIILIFLSLFCQVNLAQAVIYMARAPKSIEVYSAYGKAKSCVMEHKGPLPSVPLHLRGAPTALMRHLGFGVGYQYNPAFDKPINQTYLPDELRSVNFFEHS